MGSEQNDQKPPKNFRRRIIHVLYGLGLIFLIFVASTALTTVIVLQVFPPSGGIPPVIPTTFQKTIDDIVIFLDFVARGVVGLRSGVTQLNIADIVGGLTNSTLLKALCSLDYNLDVRMKNKTWDVAKFADKLNIIVNQTRNGY